MPRCGGCGGVCGCSLSQTASVVVSGNGQPTTPWAPSVRRSAVIGNTLTELGDGLFVGTQTPAPVVIADTNTINLSGDGTGGNPISGVLQPAPYAHRTGTGTIASTTAVDIPLGTSVEMTGFTYTAPSLVVAAGNAGIYIIEAFIQIAYSAGSTRRGGFIFINGALVTGSVIGPPPPTNATYIPLAVLARLAVGDAVSLKAEQNSGGALNVDRALRLTRTGI